MRMDPSPPISELMIKAKPGQWFVSFFVREDRKDLEGGPCKVTTVSKIFDTEAEARSWCPAGLNPGNGLVQHILPDGTIEDGFPKIVD